MKRLFVLAALVALAACNPQRPEETTAAAGPNLSIGPEGAAGLASALPMDVSAIQAAAPDYVVASVQDQVEGQPFTAITLSLDGAEVFRVLPTPENRIHAVVTTSPRVTGPAGETIGVTSFGEAPAIEVRFCLSQYVQGAPGFSCSNAQDGRFWRVYALPQGYDGASEPFEAIDPDAALAATLAEMRWIAPR